MAVSATVSVIIPTFNVAAIVGRAIEGASNQTLKPLEIIVVDNCSTDGTAEAVRKLENPLVRLIVEPSNISKARNIGFAAAKGKWLAVLDADDSMLPERLERMVEVAESKGADCVFDNVIEWDIIANRQVRIGAKLDEPLRQITAIDLYENEHDFNFRNFSYGLLKPILLRSFMTKNNIWYREDLPTGEDFTLFAEVFLNGAKTFLMRDAYYVYSMPTPPSGRSPYTRSKHDFSKILAASDALQEKYKDRIDTKLAALIAKRRNVLLLVHQANVAKQYRVSNQYLKYAWYVGTKPDLVRNLFSRSLYKVQKRLQASGR